MNNTKLRSVFDTEDYGQIELDIKKILSLKAPEITYNKLSNFLGTGHDLVSRYANNTIVRVDLDILARFCYVLKCEPEDIIKYRHPSK